MTAIKGTPPAQSSTDPPPTSQEEGAAGTSFGLAELAGSLAAEASQRLGEIVHPAPSDALTKGVDRVDGIRSRSPKSPKRGTPIPAARPVKYALQVWVTVQNKAGNWNPPEEDSYSEDFAVDTVNQFCLGCSGVYLAEADHFLAFFGKKGNPKAGLTHDQGIAACQAMRKLTLWMGEPAKLRVRVVSLAEAVVIVDSCKRMLKEDLRRAKIELQRRASSQYAFSQHALDSRVATYAVGPNATASDMAPRGQVPHPILEESLRPLYATDDDGAVSETAPVPRRGRRRGRRRASGHETDGFETDASSTTQVSGGQRIKKKSGVTNRIDLPGFGGKKGHSNEVVDAFRHWARCITHLRDYYEDDFLVTYILGSLTGDASDVYDWVIRSIREPNGHVDVGLLLAKFREHYCGTLTFREQRNRVENLRQGEREDATDFLIRVGSGVDALAKEFKDSISREEASSLQYDVFLNGVKPEIRHVLDSEIAAHGHLTADLMYDCVKRYETYVARGRRLGGNSPSTGQQRATHSRFPKTTAFAAAVGEVSEVTLETDEDTDNKADPEEAALATEESAGVYLPDFLGQAPDGNWGLNVRMAVAMQEHERQKRKCFICQSTEHLMRECPNQKNSRRPLPPRGPPKNKSVSDAAKPSPPAQQDPSK